MGAVAYRHLADNYIAVFRHFIPPGVWEAIYVIEGLLKAGLSVEADTVHSDTQASRPRSLPLPTCWAST